MSVLVRDEADVIEDNIRFHAGQGVDCFIVMDNGSVDGTRDILETLKSDFDLEVLDEPARSFDQDLWVTQMAFRIREQAKAEWMIAVDADEFWHSRTGDLKTDFIPSQSLWQNLTATFKAAPTPAVPDVFLCPRYNMLPRLSDLEAADYCFYDNVMKVARPLGQQKETPDPAQKLDYAIMLRTMPAKVMCKLEGLHSIGMGNHMVEHDWLDAKKGRVPATSSAITIYHYPIRSFRQFETKVCNQGEGLTSNQRFNAGIGWHARRWYALWQQGKLYEEYTSLVLDDDTCQTLLKQGVLAQDVTIKSQFA